MTFNLDKIRIVIKKTYIKLALNSLKGLLETHQSFQVQHPKELKNNKILSPYNQKIHLISQTLRLKNFKEKKNNIQTQG